MPYAPIIDEIELDRAICRDATGGPTGQTTIIIGGNAREQRNIDWPVTRRAWQIIWACRSTDTKFRNLINFFEARKSRGYGFRFYDWSDHSDWGQGTVALDPVSGRYRLYKTYTDTIRPVVRTIYKPIEGTITLADVEGGVDETDIDYTDGTIPDATGPGTWTGEFCIPARFDTDRFSFRMTPDLVVVWDGVPIIELI